MNTEQTVDRVELIDWLLSQYNEAKDRMVACHRDKRDSDEWLTGNYHGEMLGYKNALKELGYPVDTLS